VGVERYQALLDELGRRISRPGLEVDEYGRCTLNVGEDFQLTLYYDEPTQAITVFSGLAQLPARDIAARALQLLRANVFWSETSEATLSLDPESGVVVLARRLPEKGLDYTTFEESLLTFIAAAKTWHERLHQAVPMPPPTPAAMPSRG
jgi:hypothetical protein